MEKTIEELKTEITSLRMRIRRLEDFILNNFVDPTEYINRSEDNDEELFKIAVITISEYEYASASLLQRRLSLDYSSAARILDQLEEKGYVGKAEGSKPRKVLKKS